MKQMTPAAVERAMKLQDVMLRAMAKRITWYQAAEILGLSGRQMLRWQTRFKHEGYEGLFDRRRGTPSPKRVPLETVVRSLTADKACCSEENKDNCKYLVGHEIHTRSE
jgi:transposase